MGSWRISGDGEQLMRLGFPCCVNTPAHNLIEPPWFCFAQSCHLSFRTTAVVVLS